MTELELQKLKETISPESVFLLVSNEENETPTEQELLLRRALRLAIQEKGAIVNGHPLAPDEIREKWNSIMPEGENKDFPYLTSILIPKKNLDVKEISYSNEEGPYFVINIQTSKEGLNKENVVFKPTPIQIDGLILMKPLKNYPQIIGSRVLNPDKEKIFLLSSTNYLSTNQAYKIISTICDEVIPKNVATLLLASLIVETNNFNDNTNEENLSIGSLLLGFGADKETIKAIIKKNMTYSFAQLLGRALARTRHNKDLNSVWIFISQADLQKTGYEKAGEAVFQTILKKIQEIVPAESFYIVLHQKNNEVRAVLSVNQENAQEKMLDNIVEKLHATSSNGFFTSGPYPNFSEAEIILSKTLKDSLHSFNI